MHALDPCALNRGGVLAIAVVGWGIISPRNGAHSQDARLHFFGPLNAPRLQCAASVLTN